MVSLNMFATRVAVHDIQLDMLVKLKTSNFGYCFRLNSSNVSKEMTELQVIIAFFPKGKKVDQEIDAVPRIFLVQDARVSIRMSARFLLTF